MDARNLNCLQPLPNGLYTDHNNLKDRSFRSVWTQKQNKSLCILGAFIVPLKSIKGFSQPGYFCTASQSEEGKGIWRKKYAVLKEKFLLQLLLRQFINNRKKPPQKQYPQIDIAEKKIFWLRKFKYCIIDTDLKAKRRIWTFYQDLLRDPLSLRSFSELAFKQRIYYYLNLSHCWR